MYIRVIGLLEYMCGVINFERFRLLIILFNELNVYVLLGGQIRTREYQPTLDAMNLWYVAVITFLWRWRLLLVVVRARVCVEVCMCEKVINILRLLK